MRHQSLYALYIIKTASRQYYTGISKNISQRFRQHQSGRGAKFLRSKTDLQLVYCSQNILCLGCALRVERRLKKRPISFKLKLIDRLINLEQLISFDCERNLCRK
ncbi:endonuclease [Buzura suppressaria nucleopolyhedrovirus]|uniref:Endonuclease n=1 Tax=Buzura suppressaria nuclear polyhedrosis virus TaxID=74320 RepID=W5VKS8_NPVBS|nr:endonuclease [Buzura suppressaria nucleopolyhedrovirus]AHH82673.1 endonuclease [Buzura suppressaria nucleopolyhedrovirus]